MHALSFTIFFFRSLSIRLEKPLNFHLPRIAGVALSIIMHDIDVFTIRCFIGGYMVEISRKGKENKITENENRMSRERERNGFV